MNVEAAYHGKLTFEQKTHLMIQLKFVHEVRARRNSQELVEPPYYIQLDYLVNF